MFGEKVGVGFEALAVVFEAFVEFAAGATEAAELAAERKLFLMRGTHAGGDEVVVVGRQGQGRRVRPAGSGAEDGAQRLGKDLAGGVHAHEGVGAIGVAEVGDEAGRLGFGLHIGGARGAGGRHDGWQGLGSLAVGLSSAVPNLLSETDQVHFFVSVVVEDTFFGVEVVEFLFGLFTEEGFVGADDLLILFEALHEAGAKADDAVHALGGQERVGQDGVVLLADAVHSAGALDEPDDGPREVEVHDDVGVLEVLTFGKDIGGNEHAQFGFAFAQAAVGPGAEAAGQGHRIGSVAGGDVEVGDAGAAQFIGEIPGGVGELGEDEDLVARMGLGEETVQSLELGIPVGLPAAGALEDVQQGACVA